MYKITFNTSDELIYIVRNLPAQFKQSDIDKLENDISEKYSDSWYLVSSHMDGYYWKKVDPMDIDQEDKIEATCPECGDCDLIIGEVHSLAEAKKLVKEEGSDGTTVDGVLSDFEKLVNADKKRG